LLREYEVRIAEPKTPSESLNSNSRVYLMRALSVGFPRCRYALTSAYRIRPCPKLALELNHDMRRGLLHTIPSTYFAPKDIITVPSLANASRSSLGTLGIGCSRPSSKAAIKSLASSRDGTQTLNAGRQKRREARHGKHTRDMSIEYLSLYGWGAWVGIL